MINSQMPFSERFGKGHPLQYALLPQRDENRKERFKELDPFAECRSWPQPLALNLSWIFCTARRVWKITSGNVVKFITELE
jgi:hypothetical protein